MWQSRVDPLCSAIRNFSLHFTQFCIFILCIAFFKLQQLFGRTAMNGEQTAAAAAFQFSFSAVLFVAFLCTVVCLLVSVARISRAVSYHSFTISPICAALGNCFWDAFERKVSLNFQPNTTSKFFILKITCRYPPHHFYQFSRINSICFLNKWKS